jgi:hypothetical protein
MELLLALAIALAVAVFVSVPLRRARQRPQRSEEELRAAIADLEARKQSKYAEIRDAEADRAAGKLSDQDFEGLDAELRAEAIALLKELDRLQDRRG